MAGVIQHSIPQVLQKGFSIDPASTANRVWVYSRGNEPYCASVSKVAKQRHFYSSPAEDQGALDNAITGFESERVHHLLNAARTLASGCSVDATECAAVVAHLAIRTAHIRESFIDGVEGLLDAAKIAFGTHEGITRMLTADCETPSEFFDEVVASLSAEYRTKEFPVPFSVIRRMVFAALQENIGGILGVSANQLFEDMKSFDLGSAGRRGHIRALGKSLAPEPLVAQLIMFEWRVWDLEGELLILPDCVALGSETDDARGLRALPFADYSKSAVCVLPIGRRRVLVGSRSPLKNLAASDLNRASAESSYRFFISPCNDHRCRELAKLLGTRNSLFFKELVEESVHSIEKSPPSAEALWPSDSSDPYEKEFQNAALQVWVAYLQEESSPLKTDVSSAAIVHLVVLLTQCFARAANARGDFEKTKDFGQLFEIVSGSALQVTLYSAQFAGRFDLDGSVVLSADLRECLEDLGLERWFVRLCRLLRATNQVDPSCQQQEAVAGLAGLIEQVLWQFGVLAWHVPRSGYRVQPIPLLPFKAGNS